MIENLKAKNKSRSFPVTIQSKNAKHNSVHRKLEHYIIIGIRIQYYGIDGNVNKLSTDLYFNSFREVTKDSRTSFVIFWLTALLSIINLAGTTWLTFTKYPIRVCVCLYLLITRTVQSNNQSHKISHSQYLGGCGTPNPSRITDPTILDLRFWTSISGPFLFQVHSVRTVAHMLSMERY